MLDLHRNNKNAVSLTSTEQNLRHGCAWLCGRWRVPLILGGSRLSGGVCWSGLWIESGLLLKRGLWVAGGDGLVRLQIQVASPPSNTYGFLWVVSRMRFSFLACKWTVCPPASTYSSFVYSLLLPVPAVRSFSPPSSPPSCINQKVHSFVSWKATFREYSILICTWRLINWVHRELCWLLPALYTLSSIVAVGFVVCKAPPLLCSYHSLLIYK